MVPNMMVGAAFPIFARAARDDHDRLGYGVDRVFQASLVLGGLVVVALALGAPFAIDVVAGTSSAVGGRAADPGGRADVQLRGHHALLRAPQPAHAPRDPRDR